MLQYRFSWNQPSVIAGISYWRFYFCLFNGPIKSLHIVELLKGLQITIGKKRLTIWDGLQAHCSKLERARVEAQRGRVVLEHLPACVSDLIPVEVIRGHLKYVAMLNCCATNFIDLYQRVRRNLRSMQQRAAFLSASWKQGELTRLSSFA